MRVLVTAVAGSLLFALPGCTTSNPSGATPGTARASVGATSGGDEAADRGTTDPGSRLYGAEPLGALVVETVPRLAGGPGAEPAVLHEPATPPAPARRVGQPVYRPPGSASSRSSTPPPPPPPPHPAFPPPANPPPVDPASDVGGPPR